MKLSRVQEERGSKLASSGAVSKRVISLSENGYLGGVDRKKNDRDFSLDAYDPTKVEKV